MDGFVLAVDLGWFNSVCCWYGGPTVDPTFRTAATTPPELRRELLRRPVTRVIIEVCSPAGWVHPTLDGGLFPAGRRWRPATGLVTLAARPAAGSSWPPPSPWSPSGGRAVGVGSRWRTGEGDVRCAGSRFCQ
jgi:hypothetical protein